MIFKANLLEKFFSLNNKLKFYTTKKNIKTLKFLSLTQSLEDV